MNMFTVIMGLGLILYALALNGFFKRQKTLASAFAGAMFFVNTIFILVLHNAPKSSGSYLMVACLVLPVVPLYVYYAIVSSTTGRRTTYKLNKRA